MPKNVTWWRNWDNITAKLKKKKSFPHDLRGHCYWEKQKLWTMTTRECFGSLQTETTRRATLKTRRPKRHETRDGVYTSKARARSQKKHLEVTGSNLTLNFFSRKQDKKISNISDRQTLLLLVPQSGSLKYCQVSTADDARGLLPSSCDNKQTPPRTVTCEWRTGNCHFHFERELMQSVCRSWQLQYLRLEEQLDILENMPIRFSDYELEEKTVNINHQQQRVNAATGSDCTCAGSSPPPIRPQCVPFTQLSLCKASKQKDI